MEKIELQPIGIIHTPFEHPKNMPIQPIHSENNEGRIEIYPEFVEGLKDLDDFSHIILIYYFHLSNSYELLAKPFLDDQKRGIFSIRGPRRPNPIGLSIVELIEIKNNIIFFKNPDMVDGTPLLDIKPYIPNIDSKTTDKIGWLKNKAEQFKERKSDDRFLS